MSDAEFDTKEVSSGRLMRRLGERDGAKALDTGISLFSDKGDITLTPSGKNRLKILAEAQSVEAAEELCDFAESVISSLSTD